MPSYTEYNATPANNNSAPPVGAPEGMAPSTVNDTMRYMMAVIRDLGNRFQSRSITVTTNSVGDGAINFVTPFVSPPTVVICNGNGAANTSSVSVLTVLNGSFSFRTSPALPNQNVQVSYVAVLI